VPLVARLRVLAPWVLVVVILLLVVVVGWPPGR